LSLPQLVVCGDQSAGKSSLLEALTEIPFPRNDNLCTRFATEIILRRGVVEKMIINVIPDPRRPATDQERIKAFTASITSLDKLPTIMAEATILIGIDGNSSSGLRSGAFARDVLRMEIEGPSRPQLTVVDIPGLIQTKTKGVADTDIDLVNEITDNYISQPRTVCLAVISATNDYANQGILTKVRKVDPDGERTLGVITKPDRLIKGSGMQESFIDLARNEDIFFKLGWHVLKNRSFEESASSFAERNMSEDIFFRTSNFKVLPRDCVGIESLRERLSQLLLNHVKQELPKLRQDLETALSESEKSIHAMGKRRATPTDCKDYLVSLSLEFYDLCKAAVGGHYQGSYFIHNPDEISSVDSPASIRRLRAVVQKTNASFSDNLRLNGHKYHLNRSTVTTSQADSDSEDDGKSLAESESSSLEEIPRITTPGIPTMMSKSQSLHWANEALIRTRGKELPGNFNPFVINELFWEQSSNWRNVAVNHVEHVATICSKFLEALLSEKCPKDVKSRLWSSQIKDALAKRSEASIQELDRIWEDLRDDPINYSHYYIDTIRKQQLERTRVSLENAIEAATTRVKLSGCTSNHTSANVDIDRAIDEYSRCTDPDMDKFSCEDALDCLLSIYKVSSDKRLS
jgi:GTPase SAR1 family protein